MSRLSKLLSKHIIEPELCEIIREKTFIDFSNRHKQLSAFFFCLIGAALIASYGIANQSTAVVIGAMLIAPLMTPILGTSFAATHGDLHGAIKTFSISTLGTLSVIATSFIIAKTIPTGIPIIGNPEIESRISPSLVDLYIAIGAGLVGAYVLARPTMSDAFPGVAVAVALVPPLCVTGISLASGYWAYAYQSFLLFTVNFFAVQISSSIIFFFLGYGSRRNENQTRIHRVWFFVASITLALLIIPLVDATERTVHATITESAMTQIASQWLENSSYHLVSVNTQDNQITLQIAGFGKLPDINELKALTLKNNLDPNDVRLKVEEEYLL